MTPSSSLQAKVLPGDLLTGTPYFWYQKTERVTVARMCNCLKCNTLFAVCQILILDTLMYRECALYPRREDTGFYGATMIKKAGGRETEALQDRGATGSTLPRDPIVSREVFI